MFEVERGPDGVHQHCGGGEVEDAAGQCEQNFLKIINVTYKGLILMNTFRSETSQLEIFIFGTLKAPIYPVRLSHPEWTIHIHHLRIEKV